MSRTRNHRPCTRCFCCGYDFRRKGYTKTARRKSFKFDIYPYVAALKFE